MQILNRSVLAEMLPRSANPTAAAVGPAASAGDAALEAKKLQNATEDFEGLLIGQMLQSIRESALGGWQEQQDQSGAVALEMAESQLSKMMASSGGLGLAKSLQQSLKPSSETAEPPSLKNDLSRGSRTVREPGPRFLPLKAAPKESGS